MIIKESNFENGGEVDFTARYKEHGKGEGRMSLRKKDGSYEVYVHWFKGNTETTLCTSPKLNVCVGFANTILGTDDTVEG